MTDEEKAKYSLQARLWKQQNKDKWNAYQKEQYLKTSSPSRRNVLDRTEEEKRQRALAKSTLRATRAKQARFPDEFTQFVWAEAHDLRKRRNLLGIDWHVDHIVPLKGKNVCGLHIWSNFAVIPKIENLRKGAHHTLHEKWPQGLCP